LKRIVLADDSGIVRHVLRKVFEESGWIVCGEAENGEEAIEKVHALKPDVVILDLSMPVMNGLTAGRILKETSPGAHLILFTSHGKLLSATDLKSAGFSALISKEDAGTLVPTAQSLLDAG
jgi:DNA-binding NarL/FixJ family response regulator